MKELTSTLTTTNLGTSSFLNCEEDSFITVNLAKIIPSQEGYKIAIILSDDPSQIHIYHINKDMSNHDYTIQNVDGIINMELWEPTLIERTNIFKRYQKQVSATLLIVLSPYSVTVWDLGQYSQIFRLNRFIPKTIKSIPLEIKVLRDEISHPKKSFSKFLIATTGKFYLYSWIHNKILRKLNVGIWECFALGSNYFDNSLLLTVAPHLRAINIWSFANQRRIKSIPYNEDSPFIIAKQIRLNSDSKGMCKFACLVSTNTIMIWNIFKGELIFTNFVKCGIGSDLNFTTVERAKISPGSNRNYQKSTFAQTTLFSRENFIYSLNFERVPDELNQNSSDVLHEGQISDKYYKVNLSVSDIQESVLDLNSSREKLFFTLVKKFSEHEEDVSVAYFFRCYSIT